MNSPEINSCPSFDLQEAVTILAKQQFYFGQDRIYGRIKSISVKIKGSGLIVHRLINTLLAPAKFLYEFKWDAYLRAIVDEITVLDYDAIYTPFKEKAAMLQPFSNNNLPVITTFIISDILTALRVPAFDEVKQQIRKTARPNFPSQETLEEAFDRLCSLNNQHLSLLENLSFLNHLAEAFHFKRVQRVIGIQITKHVNYAAEDLAKLKSATK